MTSRAILAYGSQEHGRIKADRRFGIGTGRIGFAPRRAVLRPWGSRDGGDGDRAARSAPGIDRGGQGQIENSAPYRSEGVGFAGSDRRSQSVDRASGVACEVAGRARPVGLRIAAGNKSNQSRFVAVRLFHFEGGGAACPSGGHKRRIVRSGGDKIRSKAELKYGAAGPGRAGRGRAGQGKGSPLWKYQSQ